MYDRLEQLEAENDLLKSELISISNKIENYERPDGFNINTSSTPKQSKVRKIKIKNDSEMQESKLNYSQSQSQLKNNNEPIKPISTTTDSFDYKSVTDQNFILSALDEDSALETISWAILNTGRLSQIQQEIDF